MKIKTQDLTDAALDWAVALASGAAWAAWRFKEWHHDGEMHYSTSWQDGGPIIEREGIDIYQSGVWIAEIGGNKTIEGPTPLIAAMRCFVASRLGDEVDVPEELI